MVRRKWLLRLPERRRRPTRRHLPVPPAGDAPNAGIRRVDDVRRHQAPTQRLRQPKAIDREHSVSPSTQSRRRRRPSCSTHAANCSSCRMPSCCTFGRWPMMLHICGFYSVEPARLPEHVRDRAAQRLGTADHEQPPSPPARTARASVRSHRRQRLPARGTPRTGSRRRRPPGRRVHSSLARPALEEPASWCRPNRVMCLRDGTLDPGHPLKCRDADSEARPPDVSGGRFQLYPARFSRQTRSPCPASRPPTARPASLAAAQQCSRPTSDATSTEEPRFA